MYSSWEELLILSIEKQKRLQQEAEWFRLAAGQKSPQKKRVSAKLSRWFGNILIKTGEKILQYAN
jgi:hypothetical protein